jgi:hypothetical protein
MAGARNMRILFMGESGGGVDVTSQNARALGRVGADVEFDAGDGWSSKAWRETCRRIDLIHLITYSQHDPWLLRKLWVARLYGVPVVRMWVGSDVLWANQFAAAGEFARALTGLGAVNLTVADHLADELRGIGIGAATIPIIADFFAEPGDSPPLPEQPTVLAYLTSDYRRRFYGGHIIDEMIRRRPEVKFLIVNDPDTDYSDWPNVESPGTISDMQPIYARSTVLVRPTAHDGMPRMMLEALSFGRHAICSHPYPQCLHANTLDGFFDGLDRVLADATLNEAGREYVFQHFARERAALHTMELFRVMICRRRAVRRIAGVAQGVKTMLTHWATWRGRGYRPSEACGGGLALPALSA